jgi:hypothetical protein
MDDIAKQYTDIAARYTAARKVLSDAKKAHGKKSAEAKAARKAARAIKKERVAFVAANPGFTPPPAKRGGRNLGAATKNTSAGDLLKLYFELNEVRGFTINEVEKLLKNGQVEEALAGSITPNSLRHGIRPTPPPAAPVEVVSAALAIAERVQADSAPIIMQPAVEVPGEAIPPAPVAPVAVGVPAGSLSGAILGILRMAAEPLTPAQVATLVKTAGEGSITSKQAADALGRLAKQGKVNKEGSTYSVKA